MAAWRSMMLTERRWVRTTWKLSGLSVQYACKSEITLKLKGLFNKIINNTHNGAIMLFHPTSKTNADIFERLIVRWKELGYRFSTLDELTK